MVPSKKNQYRLKRSLRRTTLSNQTSFTEILFRQIGNQIDKFTQRSQSIKDEKPNRFSLADSLSAYSFQNFQLTL